MGAVVLQFDQAVERVRPAPASEVEAKLFALFQRFNVNMAMFTFDPPMVGFEHLPRGIRAHRLFNSAVIAELGAGYLDSAHYYVGWRMYHREADRRARWWRKKFLAAATNLKEIP